MDNMAMGANIALIVSVVAVIILFAVVIYLNKRLAKLEKRYQELIVNVKGESLEDLLLNRLNNVDEVKKDMTELSTRYAEMRHKLSSCVQKVGIVRYNAFEDMGSDLSFAISLLDERNNGVIFSSIYGREDSRCYAKPIVEGKSEYNLSKEEEKIIANSMK